MAKNKKIVEETPEQIEKKIQDRLNYDLKEKERCLYLIPEPTYYFDINDKVVIGNLEDVVVNKIFDNGKIYEILYSSTDTNYGNPIITSGHKMIVNWMNIRKPSNNKESLIKNTDIRLSYSQQTISSFFNKTYYFGIDFNPDYQRDYVWELEDKVALIDSIFNNIDIGKFVFIHKGYSGKYGYEILDGKQRIRAILDFFEDRFQYNGKYYSELSYKDQWHFDEYSISVAEVNELTPKQVLKYFLMVNKTGKVMSKEQLIKVEKMLEEIESKINDPDPN